jgi:hypothetical protein
MLFQRINRSDAEKVFIVVKNSYSTAAITSGQVVAFDYTTDADGVGVTRPTTALLAMPAGVVETASIAAGDYGLVQVYGHNANCLVNGSSGTAVGTPLKMQNNLFDLIRISSAITVGFAASASHTFVSGAADSTGAAVAGTVFIRAL